MAENAHSATAGKFNYHAWLMRLMGHASLCDLKISPSEDLDLKDQMQLENVRWAKCLGLARCFKNVLIIQSSGLKERGQNVTHYIPENTHQSIEAWFHLITLNEKLSLIYLS